MVSVVIPAYNAHATLSDCLTSLLQLTYPHEQTELLVVDNTSTDDTLALAKRFGTRVRVLEEKKRGPAAARNRGIAHAQGKIIAFTDADCIVEPGWLTDLVEPLRDEIIGIAGGAIRATRPCNDIELFGELIHDHEKALNVYQPAYAITMNWASPRALLERVGGFDEALRRGEDVDLTWRILQTGYRLAYQPSAVVAHHNEHTLRGLFREGVQHGYYSVVVNRKHKTFLKQYGYQRVSHASYQRLVTNLRDYKRTRSTHALCEFTFNSGKKLGKLISSARHGYLEL
jgi:GT2 family glycosyltransferase